MTQSKYLNLIILGCFSLALSACMPHMVLELVSQLGQESSSKTGTLNQASEADFGTFAAMSVTPMINGGAAATSSTSVMLTFVVTGTPTQIYVTNVAGCASGGSYMAYTAGMSMAWTLPNSNTSNTVYAMVKKGGATSACTPASIVHDNISPVASSLAVNGGTGPTNNTAVTLALVTSGTPSEMYVTQTAGCGAGGAWQVYSDTLGWVLTSANATNTVYYKVRDLALNESSCISGSILHDDIAPTFAVTTPVDGSYVNSSGASAVLFSGTCSEDGRDVVISGAGSATAICGGNSWSVSLNLSALSDGNLSFSVDHSDAATNPASTVPLTLAKDTLAPVPGTLTINSGASLTSNVLVDLAFNATGVDQMYVTQTAGCTADGVWEIYSATKAWTLTSTNATNTVYAQFRDAALNVSSCIQASIDHEDDPTLTFVTPVDPVINLDNQSNFLIGGDCSPNGQTVTISGGLSATSVCAAGTWSATFDTLLLVDGDINVNIDISNNHGVPATQVSRTISKDTVPPLDSAFAVYGGNDGSGMHYVNTLDVLLSLYSIEAAEMYVTNDMTCVLGGTWESYNAQRTWTLTTPNSVNTVYVKYRDAAKNSTVCIGASILHDNTPPAIFTVTNPITVAQVNFNNRGAVNFSGSCSEEGRRVSISGAVVITAGCTGGLWSRDVNLTGLVDGTYPLYFDFSDYHGNSSTQITRLLVKDTISPTVAFTTAIGTYANQTTVSNFSVAGTCSDDGHTVSITGAGTATTTCSSGVWSTPVDLSSAPQGSVILMVSHTDSSGNSSVPLSRSFRIDTTAPEVSISSPVADSLISSSNMAAFNVNGTCSETSRLIAISGDATANLLCSSGLWTTNLNFTAAAQGTVTINIDHYDYAGNYTRITRSFIKDSSAPNGNTISINSGAAVTGSLSVNLDLASVGASEMYVTSDYTCKGSGSWETFAATKSWTLTKVNGLNNVYVKFRDSNLNETSCLSDSIIVDQAPPTWAAVISHDSLTSSNTNSPIVTYNETAADTLSGVAKYQYAIGTGLSGAMLNDVKDWIDVTSGSFEADGMSLTAGTKYYVNMKVIDDVGNEVIKSSLGWTVDMTPPALSILSPIQNDKLIEVDQKISGRCETSNVVNIAYGTDVTGPASVSCVGGNYSFFIEITGEGGSRTLTLSQSDAQGNMATVPLTFIYVKKVEVKGQILAMAKAADGSLFYGGSFSSYSNSKIGRVIRVNSNGVKDTGIDFKSGFSGNVYASAELPDGSVIYGGDFSKYRGRTASKVAKIDSSGNLDLTFNPQVGANGANSTVRSVIVSGSSLYISGSFTTVKGKIANRIAKLDLNGNVDTSFNPQVGANGTNSHVFAMALNGNDLYLGGDFSLYRGAAANRVAKVDATTGTLTVAFSALGTDKRVLALLYSAGSLYLGGQFTTYQSSPAKGIAKVDEVTGDLDTGFSPSSGANGFAGLNLPYVTAMALYGSDIIAVGTFNSYRGLPANSIAKINLSGDLDTTFSPGTGGNGFNDVVAAVTVSGSDIYVGGSFVSYRGFRANHIAKLSGSGDLDVTFNPASGLASTGADGSVNAILPTASGIYLAGSFSSYRNGSVAHNIIKTDANGNIDVTFNPQSGENGFNGIVRALTVDATHLFVGGDFSLYQGAPAVRVAKIDLSGTLDTTFNPAVDANGPNGMVRALAIDGTSLYIGGDFTRYKNQVANRIAKLDAASGSLDTIFNPALGANGTNHNVYALSISGTDIYIGGMFTGYRGQLANRIAKVNLTSGVLDLIFNAPGGNGVNSSVFAVAASGSDIYIGGNFTTYLSTTVNRIVKISSTGVLDASFNGTGSLSPIYSLLIVGSYLYIAGDATTYRGSLMNHIAKVDRVSGVLDATFSPATGGNGMAGFNPSNPALPPTTNSLLYDGTNLRVGGVFTSYRGKQFNYGVVLDSTGAPTP